MSVTTAMQSQNLIQYATLASSITKDIAGARGVPFLSTTAALSQAIFKSVEAGTLQRIYTFLKAQQGIGKIKRLFKHIDNASRLAACKDELQQCIAIFRVHSEVSVATKLAEFRQNAKQRHEELLNLIAAHPELTSSERSVSVTGTLLSLGSSTGSLSMLPSSSHIFHGRDSELQDVVEILKHSHARLTILGTGGMGKTSLAIAALHHTEVSEKYPQRYFVACHSIVSFSDLARSIAEHIGCEKGSNLSKKIVNHFAYSPATLLVLDNFETPWEPVASRSEVEEFLSVMSGVSHLAILITMRGAERPGKVKWTRPFLAPLKPLTDEAAMETFADIADDRHDESSVRQLLELTGNLPLAVNLIAGDRRTRRAQDLLSLLSMLPDGLLDADLVQSNLPIPNILASKATLIRTSLAYTGNDQRLKVLVPIREHVSGIYPPSASLKFSLRQHFHKVLQIWGNINILRTEDMNDPIYGNYLIENFKLAVGPIKDVDNLIELGTQHFQHAEILEQVKWYNALTVYYYRRNEMSKSHKYSQLALANAKGIPNPSIQGRQVLSNISDIMNNTGNPSDAHVFAQQAQHYADYLGDILGQARALQTQASSQMTMGDFQYAKTLNKSARDLLDTCGLQGGTLDLIARQDEAEIHFLKTEYAQARTVHAAIAGARAPGQPETYEGTFSRLNIALIDIATGANLGAVHRSLESCRLHFETSSAHPRVVLQCDMAGADLYLHEGKLPAAREMFERCFLACWNTYMDGATFCIERLADLSAGMYTARAAFPWAVVYLGNPSCNASATRSVSGKCKVACPRFTASTGHSTRNSPLAIDLAC
ncbi:hypothetical protein DFH09DRAFT_1082733 [Mycena vulgaris]|nr:hypothetical protein DFH09DRAFT_1082733 [Mycena vulgaris]